MTLSRFLSLTGLSDDDFAAKIGVDRSSVSRWRRGRARPDWSVMPLIVTATNGAVTANDFAAPHVHVREGVAS